MIQMTEERMGKIGQWLGVALGSLLSPSWPLIQHELMPHLPLFKLQQAGLSDPAVLTQVLDTFVHKLSANHAALAIQLLPMLLLTLGLSVLILFLSSTAGRKLGYFFYKKQKPTLTKSIPTQTT